MPPHVDEFVAYRGQIVDAGQSFDGAVVVQGRAITEVLRSPAKGNLPPKLRSCGQIWPGLIDMQVNGAFGHEVDGVANSFVQMARHLPRVGVTSFAPTLISSPRNHYAKVFAAYQQSIPSTSTSAASDQIYGPTIESAQFCGMHLEGPFISLAQSGIHSRDAIAAADEALFDALLEDPSWAMMTLAPECPGNILRITRLRQYGKLVAIGHSDGNGVDLQAGIEAGAKMVTHLYNAMSGFHHRGSGIVAATWLESGVVASIIADGLHCSPESLALAYRLKGAEGLVLVSDSMAAAGLGPGEYRFAGQSLSVRKADEVEYFRRPTLTASESSFLGPEAGPRLVAQTADGRLAGAVLTLDQAVRNMASFAQIPLAKALRMASEIPAKMLGLANKGRIRPGADADLLLMDQNLEVEATLVLGKLAYDRGQA